MYVVSANEWQDCYRIIDGYLFIVNKFIEVDDLGSTYIIPKNHYKKVAKGIKGNLWILTRPVKRYGGRSQEGLLEQDEENGEFPIGTVFYNEIPVRKTDNPYQYDCFARASYNCLHGDLEYWKIITEEIEKIVNLYQGEHNSDLNSELSLLLEDKYKSIGTDFAYEDSPLDLRIDKLKDRKPPEGKSMSKAQKIVHWCDTQESGKLFKMNELLSETGLSNDSFKDAKKSNQTLKLLFEQMQTNKKGYYRIS